MLIFSQFYLPTKFIGGLQGYRRAWSKYVGSLLKIPGEENKTEFGVRTRGTGRQCEEGQAPGGQALSPRPPRPCLGYPLRDTLARSRWTRAAPAGPRTLASQFGKQRRRADGIS